MSGSASRQAPLMAFMLALLVMVLPACAQIPTSGPVGKSSEGSAGNVSAPVFLPAGPEQGASPETIIDYFYRAGSGYEDDYAVARQYLTQASSVAWRPDRRALVYRDARVVPTDTENVYHYELDVAYTVDPDGIATQSPEGTVEKIPVTVAQVDGEWRISDIPDGTAIPEETFKVIYGAYPIYFYDPTFTYAVPDVRWFIKNKTVKAMTSALLAGPAPYLRGAVASAFPSGIQLARESVPVVSGAAQVDLTAKELMATSAEDRLRMQMQLTLTFRSQPDVVNVELRANQDLVRVEDDGTVLPPVQNKSVPSRQIAISDGDLARYENNRISPLPDMLPVSSLDPRYPAESPAAQAAAFLNAGRTTLYSILPGQPARAMTTRSTLTRPSFDLHDWAWTAGPGASGGSEVAAFRPAGVAAGQAVPSVTLKPAWLAGRAVKDFRISREGVRALVISEQNGRTRVQITGIIRGGDGTPRELTAPVTLVASGQPEQGVWVTDTTVAVMKGSKAANVTPELLSLTSGEPQPLAPWPGLMALSAGNGTDEIYGQSAEGIFQRLGNGWSPQIKGPLDPAFPG